MSDSGADRTRRQWSQEEARQIVAQTLVLGMSVSQVARRYDVNASRWRRAGWSGNWREPERDAGAAFVGPFGDRVTSRVNTRTQGLVAHAAPTDTGPQPPSGANPKQRLRTCPRRPPNRSTSTSRPQLRSIQRSWMPCSRGFNAPTTHTLKSTP